MNENISKLESNKSYILKLHTPQKWKIQNLKPITITNTTVQVYIVALSRTNNTKLNGGVMSIESQVQLFHDDVFTIGDRHFRWEYPTGSKLFKIKRPAASASSSPIKSTPAEVPITKRLAELENEATPNRKRVSFGHYISPELFDKDLPPDTPVRKGSVPVSELKKGASMDSPRPGALARSLAIKRSTSNTPKRPSVAPSTPRIAEENSPKGVLKRQDNDLPPTKVNSGYRSSPRTSTGSDSDVDLTPRRKSRSPVNETDDANQAKTSKIKTTSPRKDVKVLAKKTTPAKTPKAKVDVSKKAKTPTLPTRRKSAVSPPNSQSKKRRTSAPPQVELAPTAKTPNIKAPVDEILKRSVGSKAIKTPMVATPAKGSTPKISTPRDLILESPGADQENSPKISKIKTPKSVKAVKTLKSVKAVKTPKSVKKASLYSEVLKKDLRKSAKSSKVARVENGKITKPPKKTKVQVKSPIKSKKSAASSTGHVNSPENIVIGRRTPKVCYLRKYLSCLLFTTLQVAATKAGKTPKSVSKKLGVRTPAGKPLRRTLWSEVVKKNLGRTPKGKAVVSSKVLPSKQIKKTSVKDTKTAKKEVKSVNTTGHANSPAPIIITKRAQKTQTPVVTKRGRKSDVRKAGGVVPDNTDYEGVSDMLQTPGNKTPQIVVSTPSDRKSSEKRFPKNMSTVETHKRIGRSPEDLKRRRSMGSPMVTPQNKIINKLKAAAPASERGKRRNSFRGSPSKNFLSQSLSLPGTPGDGNDTNFDFDSVETPSLPVEMLVSPMVADKSPRNDLTDLTGVKKLMRTPRQPQKGPRNVIDDVRGVKKLVATPGNKQKQPKNDLTDVAGVKKLMTTPKSQKAAKNDLTDVVGVKKLMATPKAQKAVKDDLTDVAGVKQLLGSPRNQRNPKNELVDLVGVKKMLRTPKTMKGPKNDLSNVAGVKALMSTPKTPFNSPVANYSDVQGVKKLLKTPGLPPKSPKNVLDDFTGVSDLVRTPNSVAAVSAVSEGPSTSRTGRRKRKVADVETEIEANVVGSATKKAKVDESTTSKGTSRTKSSAKTRSPSKTTRGGKVSPKMDIPKFNLEDVEDSPAVVKPAKTTRGRKAAAKVIEEEPTEEAIAPRARRGRKAVEVSEEKKETPALKPKRGRKPAEPVEEVEKEETPVSKPKRGRKKAEEPKKTVDKSVTADEQIDEAPKSSRGKRTKKADEENQTEDTPATVGRPSRRGKSKVEEAETPAQEVKTTGRRGRGKVVQETLEATITKQPPKSRLAKVMEEEKVSSEITPRKGRGRGKKTEDEVVQTPASPPKRGKKTQKAEDIIEDSKEEVKSKPARKGRKVAEVIEVMLI